MKRIAYFLTTLLAGALVLSSCVKKSFDAPSDTTGYDPQLAVTHTIQQLKWMNGRFDYTTGGDTTIISQDVVVAGIVTADDRSGNLYKQILIEDSTGGIMVLIDNYNLYADYPVGRKVYIRCKGLQLGYDGGLPVLGMKAAEGTTPEGISPATMTTHLVKADVGHTVTPKVVNLAQVRTADSNLYNRLITISEAQFVDTTKTFTQPNGTTNRDIEDCIGNKMPVRTSNFANFSSYKVPGGKGSITAIYTVFISSTSGSRTAQLVLRDTSDVKFYGPRCTGSTPTPGALISIDSLRKLYPGTGTITLPNVRVTGVVISDIDKGNAASGNFILEDGSRKGITMYIPNSTAYKLGDSLVLDVSAGKLQLYNGGIELTGVTTSKITKAATGKSVAPLQITIATLNANFFNYESTLVKIVNATISGGSTYSGTKTLNDGTGTIALYTASGASFASQPIPSGAKTVVGIATPFTSGNEIKLRDPATDVY